MSYSMGLAAPGYVQHLCISENCVSFMSEDSEWFQCMGYDYTAFMDYMDLDTGP